MPATDVAASVARCASSQPNAARRSAPPRQTAAERGYATNASSSGWSPHELGTPPVTLEPHHPRRRMETHPPAHPQPRRLRMPDPRPALHGRRERGRQDHPGQPRRQRHRRRQPARRLPALPPGKDSTRGRRRRPPQSATSTQPQATAANPPGRLFAKRVSRSRRAVVYPSGRMHGSAATPGG